MTPALSSSQARALAVPSRQPVNGGFEQVGHALHLAGEVQVLGDGEHPLGALRRVSRCEAQRVLGQYNRLRPRAPRRGPGGGSGQPGSELVVGPVGCQRQVQRTQLLVGYRGRDRDVHLPTLLESRLVHGRGRQQGVRCPHPGFVIDQHPVLEGGVDAGLPRDRLEHVTTEAAAEGDGEQQPAHAGSQRDRARSQSVLHAGGQG